jgi:hypothetical protein
MPMLAASDLPPIREHAWQVLSALTSAALHQATAVAAA